MAQSHIKAPRRRKRRTPEPVTYTVRACRDADSDVGEVEIFGSNGIYVFLMPKQNPPVWIPRSVWAQVAEVRKAEGLPPNKVALALADS